VRVVRVVRQIQMVHLAQILFFLQSQPLLVEVVAQELELV
jgi:hypothetical protein